MLGGLLIFMAARIGANAGAADSAPFRVGFSSATFGDVNENDASAAVRVWAQALAKERGIPADPQPRILRGLIDIEAALTNQLIDAINITTDEYAALQDRIALQHCLVAVKGKSITEDYLLLVHRSSGIERLAQLRGRKLGLLHAARASIAPMWLENLLAREHLGACDTFFSQTLRVPKISKAVLPVFFKQLDACVVTRSGFETMIELNPQIGDQLQILASSTPVIPVFFSFRADYTSDLRTNLLGQVAQWHTTPSGRQILNLFQTDNLEERPFSCLGNTLELLAEHDRIGRGTNSASAGPMRASLDARQGELK